MTFRVTEQDADHAGAELEDTTAGLVRRLALTPRVTDAASLAQAKLDRQTLAEAIGRVETWFKPLKASAYGLWQTLCKRERTILDPLRAADQQKADDIRQYHDAEARERRRLELEAAALAKRDREREAAIEAAAVEASDPELAAAILEEAIAAPAPVIALPDPAAGIVTFTRRWHWKYAGGPMDRKATPPDVLARALERIPIQFHAIDDVKIGQYVRSMKGSAKIPGVDVYYTDDPNR
jgi:hypothetical protein